MASYGASRCSKNSIHMTPALLLTAVLIVATINCASHGVLAARELPTGGDTAEDMKARFQRWMADNGRTYKDAAEKARRFQVFAANAGLVDSSNNAAGKYRLATNKFADLTTAEFIAMYAGYKPMPSSGGGSKLPGFKYENVSLPRTLGVDWRKNGAVTGVKNQARCGSCWVFSAVAAVEGVHQITAGELVSLSEQQVLDCSGNNDGCGGGDMDEAFQYISDGGGLTTESAYPYQGAQGATCRFSRASSTAAATIRGYQDVPKNNEAALAVAVANQPVTVAVDASNFQLYQSGVMTADSCGTNLNHAVTVVGYEVNAADGSKYWVIKNSWGRDWGEEGYLRLEKDTVASRQGACGVAMNPSFPVA